MYSPLIAPYERGCELGQNAPGGKSPRGAVYPAVTGGRRSTVGWITGSRFGFPPIGAGTLLDGLVVRLDFSVPALLFLPVPFVPGGTPLGRRTTRLRRLSVELAGHLVPELRERLARGANLVRVVSLDRLLERLEPGL